MSSRSRASIRAVCDVSGTTENPEHDTAEVAKERDGEGHPEDPSGH